MCNKFQIIVSERKITVTKKEKVLWETAEPFLFLKWRSGSPNIRISNTLCSFPPFTRLNMIILGGESYSDTYMYKKIASFVQARRIVFLIHIGPE